MRRIFLIRSRRGEAEARATLLRSADCEVAWGPVDRAALSTLPEDPPDAVVIDLDQGPSQGRDIGIALRINPCTRRVPLVFAGGDPEKVAGVRNLLPDAVYTTWDRVREAVALAMAHPPQEPVVPAGNLAGYSGTPLPKKLGIKPESEVLLLDAPEDFQDTLGDLPPGAALRRDASARGDLVIWFVRSRDDLERRISDVAERMGAGGLWIAWPKKASGVVTDVSETIVREIGLASGLVDYKICAIDTTWSGLRFARRKNR